MSRQPIQKRTDPAFIEPMQCKPVTALPAGETCTFEVKLDGYRCIAVKLAKAVTLFSRHKKVLNRRFPDVVEALTSHRNGEFLIKLPLSSRRQALESLLAAPKDPLRLSPLLQAPLGEVLEGVRRLGLEGVVGKRTDSVYEPGERSGAWIKLRANMEQEFVIGGYIPGTRGFDALLVGVYENKELKLSRR